MRGEREGERDSGRETETCERQSFAKHQPEHVMLLRAQRNADAELAPAQFDDVADHAEQADGRERNREAGKRAEQNRRETMWGKRSREHAFHRSRAND